MNRMNYLTVANLSRRRHLENRSLERDLNRNSADLYSKSRDSERDFPYEFNPIFGMVLTYLVGGNLDGR